MGSKVLKSLFGKWRGYMRTISAALNSCSPRERLLGRNQYGSRHAALRVNQKRPNLAPLQQRLFGLILAGMAGMLKGSFRVLLVPFGTVWLQRTPRFMNPLHEGRMLVFWLMPCSVKVWISKTSCSEQTLRPLECTPFHAAGTVAEHRNPRSRLALKNRLIVRFGTDMARNIYQVSTPEVVVQNMRMLISCPCRFLQ